MAAERSASVPPDQRPSDYSYAYLSNLVYKNLDKDGDDAELTIDGVIWQLKSVHSGKRGFYAAIFQNPVARQLVVAFRGTDCFKSLLEDINGIYLNDATSPQKEEAFKLVAHVQALASGRFPWNISFTGHSLGAYLAELSLLYLIMTGQPEQGKIDLREHAHAVTFESPGTFAAMQKIQSSLVSNEIEVNNLDIVGYLSYPNLVNTCDKHVGSVYSLRPTVSDWSNVPGVHLKQVHSMQGIVDLFEHENSGADHQPPRYFLLNWPIKGQRDEFFKHVTLRDGQYQWSKPFEELQANFSLAIGGGYRADERLGNWQSLPAQHLGGSLQKWLFEFFKEFYSATFRLPANQLQDLFDHLKKDCDVDVLNILFKLKLVHNPYSSRHYLEIMWPEGTQPPKIAQSRATLSGWLITKPEASTRLLQALRDFLQRPDIAAYALAPGSSVEVEAQGKVFIRGIHGIDIDIPSDTSPALVEHFQQVSKVFLNNVKETGLRIVAEGVATGARVHIHSGGELHISDVTAIKFRVGSSISPTSDKRIVELFGPEAESAAKRARSS